jgi:hypothetical protein
MNSRVAVRAMNRQEHRTIRSQLNKSTLPKIAAKSEMMRER